MGRDQYGGNGLGLRDPLLTDRLPETGEHERYLGQPQKNIAFSRVKRSYVFRSMSKSHIQCSPALTSFPGPP
jgi:hypothetical protein